MGVIGANSQQRLNRVVGEGRDLGLDAITGKLWCRLSAGSSIDSEWLTHIVNCKALGRYPRREIFLNARLFSPYQMSHDGQELCMVNSEPE